MKIKSKKSFLSYHIDNGWRKRSGKIQGRAYIMLPMLQKNTCKCRKYAKMLTEIVFWVISLWWTFSLFLTLFYGLFKIPWVGIILSSINLCMCVSVSVAVPKVATVHRTKSSLCPEMGFLIGHFILIPFPKWCVRFF